jgi:Concanavalin A-like lectin/glucanases superfamily/CHRD domain
VCHNPQPLKNQQIIIIFEQKTYPNPMKKLIFLFLLFLSLTTFSVSARVFGVRATLNGANVVPANATTATGTLTGTFDDVSGLLSFTISHTNVPLTNGFFYTYTINTGAAGTSGTNFYFNNVPTNPFIGSVTVQNIPNVLAGNTYLEVTGGSGVKIRGQLIVNQAVEIFNNNNQNDFYGIGGYSHTDGFIPNGVRSSPYVWTGPSPQNDFTYVATTPDGSDLFGTIGRLSTLNPNTAITLTFKGNNVRKLGLKVYEEDNFGTLTSGDINATITTNLNNTATLTSTDGARFVGFRVTNPDEYIVSATFSANAELFTSLDEIMFGDDTPQNVALNFDGVNDNVAIPSAVGNFAFNQNFTVTAWVKIPSANQPNTLNIDNDILEKWSLVGGYPFVIRYFNHTASVGNRFKINVGRWDGTNNPNMFSTMTLNDDQWHHIAFVKNGTTLRLYIDGLQNNTTTDNTTGTTTNSSALFVGSRGNNTNFFKGEIDEVRIIGYAKTQPEIQNERFCKNPDSNFEVARYNFGNGVPHDNNTLITQVQDGVGSNHGTLNNFTKTGDASNFVTGQVKYVNAGATTGGNNGSSWANAFTNLQSALPANTCNNLFDVWVANGTYKPAVSDINSFFTIPSGMSIYGGFAGTEKSINQRNRALILTTNETTLSGDLSDDDFLSDFNQNRGDNSYTVVNLSNANIILDGFSIRGGFDEEGESGGISAIFSENIQINQCKIFDNSANAGGGIYAVGVNNLLISNTYLLGNRAATSEGGAIFFSSNNGTKNMKLNNCVIAGHTGTAIFAEARDNISSILNHSYTNCTFANNSNAIINDLREGATINLTLKNSIIYGNTTGISVSNLGGTYNPTITYSLVQGGLISGTGNLNGNTTNPQFVNLPTTRPSTAGDFRLKDPSPCINVGDDVGVSPLDLDRNPRPRGGKTDMGAFESNVNMNEIISIVNGNWESNSTWNLNRLPLATDKVILNGHNVMIGTNLARAKDLEYKTGAILRYVSGGLLRFGL